MVKLLLLRLTTHGKIGKYLTSYLLLDLRPESASLASLCDVLPDTVVGTDTEGTGVLRLLFPPRDPFPLPFPFPLIAAFDLTVSSDVAGLSDSVFAVGLVSAGELSVFNSEGVISLDGTALLITVVNSEGVMFSGGTALLLSLADGGLRLGDGTTITDEEDKEGVPTTDGMAAPLLTTEGLAGIRLIPPPVVVLLDADPSPLILSTAFTR